ncbi:MAG: formylglycine-generating enzyme family protein [Aeromicrobium sp.]
MSTQTTSAPAGSVKGMVRVPGGGFTMGSLDFYPEERPVVPSVVDDLWVDEHPVTNAEFRRFVASTGHVTVAEQAPDAADFPGARQADLVPGSLVFRRTPGPVPLTDWRQWWGWVPGADWRHPQGPGSTLHGLERHPVVHVAHEDATAYADWCGKRLPTEPEWEHAARGGLDGATYAWGDEFTPRGRVMANTWHGDFPWRGDRGSSDGRTSAVAVFPPNGYGLFDTTGNVWEWTGSRWTDSHVEAGPATPPPHSCCAPTHEAPADETTRMVMKGGSHVCAPSYCHRYRPAARQGQTVRSTTSHLGFRCVRSV